MPDEHRVLIDGVWRKTSELKLPKGTPRSMEIVGACICCGNPIYGWKTVSPEAGTPEVKRTCDCQRYCQMRCTNC